MSEWKNDRPPGFDPDDYCKGCEVSRCPTLCGPSAYDAGWRDCLAALRERGEDMSGCNAWDWKIVCEEWAEKFCQQPGHLIWLPEVEG